MAAKRQSVSNQVNLDNCQPGETLEWLLENLEYRANWSNRFMPVCISEAVALVALAREGLESRRHKDDPCNVCLHNDGQADSITLVCCECCYGTTSKFQAKDVRDE